MDCNMPGFPVLHYLLEFAQTHVHWWCHPTVSFSVVPFSSCLQPFPTSGSFPVSILCIRWPKYWSFSFSSSPSNEYSRLFSCRVDCFVLLAVEGLNLLQHHHSKTSNLQPSLQSNSHIYMTTEKTIILTIWNLVGKVMSLLNTLSRCVLDFFFQGPSVLISWLQSWFTAILEPKKISLSLFPFFSHLFVTKWWDCMGFQVGLLVKNLPMQET